MLVLFWLLMIFVNPSFALTVEVPWDAPTLKDTNVPSSLIQGNSDSIITLVQQINDYLWFTIAAICLAVAIYAGIKLLLAQWEKAKMQKANETLVGALVGVFIAVFAYVLVRIIVNLF